MKKLAIALFIATFFCVNAQQKAETKEVKRFMSLGEKSGYKLVLPNQELSKVEKINKEFLKDQNAEILKSPKGSNEQIFKKFYLKGVEQPLLLFAIMEQEGKNVGWTGYFFNEKDSTNLDNSTAVNVFLTSLFNKSMYKLYEDSINFQEKKVKEANNGLKDKSKDADKNQKNINNAKDKIRNAEQAIEKSNANITSFKNQIGELTNKKNASESKLKEANAEMSKAEGVEKEIKESLNKLKKLNKNLSELQKDPATNANLIIAQTNDINLLTEAINKRQIEYKDMNNAAKSNLKAAEKDAKKAECDLKDAEKAIKKENDNISKSNNQITDSRKSIEDNQKSIDTFNSAEKSKSEDEIKAQNQLLENLKATQSLYK